MKASRRRARKQTRAALARVSPVGNERWRLLGLTGPTPVGIGLKLTKKLYNVAWSLMRKGRWWKEESKIRAGIKGEEFTLGDERCDEHRRLKKHKKSKECRGCEACNSFEWSFERDGYHVHFHVLVLSEWVVWEDLGREWTACLKRAAKKLGILLEINTSHGRAVVDVRLVTNRKTKARGAIHIDDAIEEVCKYITKPESWLKIPAEQLCEVARELRGRRMIEPLGELSQRKGSERGRRRKTPAERAAEAEVARRAELERAAVVRAEALSLLEWIDSDPRSGRPVVSLDWRAMVSREAVERAQTYLDTQNTIDGGGEAAPGLRGRVIAERARRKPLRLLGAEMIARGEREKWLMLLRAYVAGVQEFRRSALARRFLYAEFSALDGQRWYGLRANPASSFAMAKKKINAAQRPHVKRL
jgi:hypothetical protein